jgi:hypothetical protein
MKLFHKLTWAVLAVFALGGVICLVGCSEDSPVIPRHTEGSFFDGEDPFDQAKSAGIEIEIQDGSITPPDLVTVSCFGRSFTLWPFTGAMLDGSPMDPVNLIFSGHADPVQIRAALLALDGDRSALGLPDAYPFNQVWTDAVGGNVQAAYADEGRWVGSVIQLTLGDYEPVRFHLRLFRTAARGADGLPLTIGAAHFEVLIPGTTDHQVLSWNAAKEIVVGDMMRTGLLNPAEHLLPTGAITPAPGFRTILPAVYNGLPAELLDIVGGPPPPVTDPVPIPNDGQAMMIYLAAPAEVTAEYHQAATTVTFGQFVPRPYCSTGPADWLWIEGDVEFHNTYRVDRRGRYSYWGGYRGLLTATPVDIETGQPSGEPFTADVWGRQHGFIGASYGLVRGFDKKITHEAAGPQIDFVDLRVSEHGRDRYRQFTRCIDEG